MECFADDHYYKALFKEQENPEDEMIKEIRLVLLYCLNCGYVMGIKHNGELVAFLISFNYKDICQDEEAFKLIFEDKRTHKIPYEDSFHRRVQAIPGLVTYIMTIAVKKEFRRKGLASGLVDCLMLENEEATIVSDISNEKSLDMYKARQFSVTEILDDNYFLVVRKTSQDAIAILS